MFELFDQLIKFPLYNVLIYLYGLVGNLGLAIILVTLIVRLAMLPLANKAFRSQRRLQALQPELQKLQEKHKDDRETLAKEIMAFYKREGVSPASSCLPTLIQIPLLVALFFVFMDAVPNLHPEWLYSFVPKPESLDPHFLGLNLSEKDVYFLPVITALLQFQQSRMLLPTTGDIPGISRQMVYLLPLLTLVFAMTLPAALPLYWASSTLFTLIQQYVIMREMPLAEAKAEGVADWNAANPQDAITGKTRVKSRQASKKANKKGASVTVRKRGE